MSAYLYDMGGEPIAFRRTWNDPYLFDLDGDWIGHFAWGDNDVADTGGRYLGSVVNDRLVRRNDWYERPCRFVAPAPEPAACTGQPTSPLAFPNRFAYEDVQIDPLT